MTGEEISVHELNTLFEAARWAPSSGNSQPWRFLFARRNTPAWDTFFNLLVPGNQVWAHKAAALVLVVSRTVAEHNGKPMVTHSFDTGAAWMSLALQGSMKGLLVHGMGGYDRAKAMEDLKIPPEFVPEAMIAIGHHGDLENLVEEKRAGDVNPSQRKALDEIVFEGGWPNV